MKRSTTLVLAALFALAAALPAAAEGLKLGLKAGYGFASASTSTSLDTPQDVDPSGNFVGGLALEGQLYKAWTLETEVLWARRTADATFFGGNTDYGQPMGDITAEYTFDTLEIPFHAKYRFPQGDFSPHVFFGWNTMIPLEIKSKNTADGESITVKAKDQFQSVWVALELGAGFDWKVGDGTALTLDARYVYGLTDTAAVAGDSWKWRDVRILAGVKFDL